MLARINKRLLPHVRPGWDDNIHDDIVHVASSYPEIIDLEMMHAVGENLPVVVRGGMNMLEPMVQGNKLNWFHVDALGMPSYLNELSRIAAQISNRWPRMRVLEVGAGTGGATRIFLKRLGNAHAYYKHTNICSGFFNTAQSVFDGSHPANMASKTLDIGKDVAEQGYAEHTFDLVVANLVLHDNRDLEATMSKPRYLFKPVGTCFFSEA